MTTRPQTPATRILRTVALFAIYFVVARTALKFNAVSGFAALVWPPSGLALAALVLFGRDLWPGIAAAAFAVNWSLGAPLAVAVGMGAGNTLEALIGLELLTFFGFDPRLLRLRDAFALIIGAAILSTLVSATLGVASLYLGGVVGKSALLPTWTAWWLGDILGDLIVAPLLLVWPVSRIDLNTTPASRIAEIVGLLALVLFGGIAIFSDQLFPVTSPLPHPYFIFPILMTVAVRLDPKWTVTALFIVAVIVISSTATGHARGWTGPLNQRLLQAQIFLGVAAVSKLVLAAATAESRSREAEKRRSEECQRFLKEATQLLSESIDYQTTLEHVARAAVPRFSDWCVVQVLNEDGTFQAAKLACDIPEKESILRQLVARYYSDLEGPTLLARTIKGKTSRIIRQADDETYRAIAKEEQHYRLLKELDFSSLIASPLLLRDKLLGAIAVGSFRRDYAYGNDDIAILEELARRAAIAIENARLYQDAQRRSSRATSSFRSPRTSSRRRSPRSRCGSRSSIARCRGASSSRPLSARSPRYPTSCSSPRRWLRAWSSASGRPRSSRSCSRSSSISRESVLAICRSPARTSISSRSPRRSSTASASSCCRKASRSRSSRRGPVRGFWDRMRVDQVITNLVSNAIKYGEGKPITIAIESNPESRMAWIRRARPGPGHPDKLQAKILSASSAPASQDARCRTGSRPLIVKQIVLAHGGQVQLESHEEEGSTFTVELPKTV